MDAQLALLGTALTVIGGLLGVAFSKWLDARSKREDSVYVRLQRVEEREAKCQEQVWELKTDMQTLLLANSILIKEVPGGDEKLRGVMQNLTERRKRLMDIQDAEGGG